MQIRALKGSGELWVLNGGDTICPAEAARTYQLQIHPDLRSSVRRRKGQGDRDMHDSPTKLVKVCSGQVHVHTAATIERSASVLVGAVREYGRLASGGEVATIRRELSAGDRR